MEDGLYTRISKKKQLHSKQARQETWQQKDQVGVTAAVSMRQSFFSKQAPLLFSVECKQTPAQDGFMEAGAEERKRKKGPPSIRQSSKKRGRGGWGG